MLRLGLQLTLHSGREALVRLLITAAAVAVGVALLLGVLAEFHAFQANASKQCWSCTQGASVPATLPAHGELWNNSVDFYQGQTISRLDVAALGPDAPVPPGITHLPPPGDYYASPALAGAALVGTQYFESDLTPTLAGYAAMLVGVPIAAAVAALVSLRRVQISPLGVTRRAKPKPPTFWRVIALLIGVGVYIYGLDKTSKESIGAPSYPGLLLTMIGLLIAGPWLTAQAARLFGRLARGSSAGSVPSLAPPSTRCMTCRRERNRGRSPSAAQTCASSAGWESARQGCVLSRCKMTRSSTTTPGSATSRSSTPPPRRTPGT